MNDLAFGLKDGDRWKYRDHKLVKHYYGIEVNGPLLKNMVYATKRNAHEGIDHAIETLREVIRVIEEQKII